MFSSRHLLLSSIYLLQMALDKFSNLAQGLMLIFTGRGQHQFRPPGGGQQEDIENALGVAVTAIIEPLKPQVALEAVPEPHYAGCRACVQPESILNDDRPLLHISHQRSAIGVQLLLKSSDSGLWLMAES
jgi:hypothetical protein